MELAEEFFAVFERIISTGTTGYVAALRGAMRARFAVVVLFFVGLGATYLVYRSVPQAFVPEEDQGYFLIQIQARCRNDKPRADGTERSLVLREPSGSCPGGVGPAGERVPGRLCEEVAIGRYG